MARVGTRTSASRSLFIGETLIGPRILDCTLGRGMILQLGQLLTQLLPGLWELCIHFVSRLTSCHASHHRHPGTDGLVGHGLGLQRRHVVLHHANFSKVRRETKVNAQLPEPWSS